MNIVSKVTQYFKEVRYELKRVTWSSRKEAIAGTVIVLVIVSIAAVFFGIVDIGLSKIIKMVLK